MRGVAASGAPISFMLLAPGKQTILEKWRRAEKIPSASRGQKCPGAFTGGNSSVRQSVTQSLTVCSGYNGQPSIYIVFYDVYKDNQYEYAMAAIMTRRQDRMWNNCRHRSAAECELCDNGMMRVWLILHSLLGNWRKWINDWWRLPMALKTQQPRTFDAKQQEALTRAFIGQHCRTNRWTKAREQKPPKSLYGSDLKGHVREYWNWGVCGTVCQHEAQIDWL